MNQKQRPLGIPNRFNQSESESRAGFPGDDRKRIDCRAYHLPSNSAAAPVLQECGPYRKRHKKGLSERGDFRIAGDARRWIFVAGGCVICPKKSVKKGKERGEVSVEMLMQPAVVYPMNLGAGQNYASSAKADADVRMDEC